MIWVAFCFPMSTHRLRFLMYILVQLMHVRNPNLQFEGRCKHRLLGSSFISVKPTALYMMKPRC